MARVAGQHPQTAYSGLQKSLKKVWYFVQHVTPVIGLAFHPVEDDLHDAFLPDLFKGFVSQIPGIVVTSLPVNQAGIALPGHNHTAGANWMAYCVITGHLVTVLHVVDEFRLGDHALLMVEVRYKIRLRHAKAAEMALGAAWAAASKGDVRLMGRIMWTGVWLSVLPSIINGKELGV